MIAFYNASVLVWEVEYTDQFEDWWDDQSEEVQEAVTAAVEVLAEAGPGLGRPVVDSIHQSRHSNMKELRARGTIRVLFAFDPLRVALLLLGGDKRGEGNEWYDRNLPIADDLFDEHLGAIGKKGGNS